MQPDVWGRTRVLVADSSDTMLRTISRIIRLQFDVVGEVRDGRAALDLVTKLAPDVAVLDILLPNLDGIQVTRRIRELKSNCRVLILTGLQDQSYVDAALEAGAQGFVFKRKMGSDLLLAIAEMAAGRRFRSSASPRSERT